MTTRRWRFTNIAGHREEFAGENLIITDRHTHREARSQKSQLNSIHRHGERKDYKIPIKHKLT